jgi:hypothetical protein
MAKWSVTRVVSGVLFVVCLCVPVAPAIATTINVDFSVTALAQYSGVGAAPDAGVYWNNATSSTKDHLRTSDNSTDTGASFALTGGTGPDLWDGTTEADALVAPKLMNDLFYATGNVTLSINGLDPSKKYDLYLYSQDAGYHNTTNTFTIGSESRTADNTLDSANPASFELGVNYVKFSDVAAVEGTISVSFSGYVGIDPTRATSINGFQIVSVPEPSALALLGVGAISLLAYARRKRM